MELKIFDLGLVDFKKAWDFQKEKFNEVKEGRIPNAVIFCRHNPVITLGRQANPRNILVTKTELQKKGISVYEIERGGDVTYHGPGQLMIYPLINLTLVKRDIHLFLRNLEKIAIEAFAELGILTQRVSGLTGVWLGNKKIASIGIAIKNWITYHGIALNIKQDDLENFSLIRPCGMDIMMTSLEASLEGRIEFLDVKKILTRRLQDDKSCFA